MKHIITRYKRIGYSTAIMRKTASLDFNTITADSLSLKWQDGWSGHRLIKVPNRTSHYLFLGKALLRDCDIF